jgi:hypothetical protein
VSDLGFGAISITHLTLVITVMSLTHSLTKCQTANFFGNSNDYNRPIDFIESCHVGVDICLYISLPKISDKTVMQTSAAS